jgi:hypothetical protein
MEGFSENGSKPPAIAPVCSGAAKSHPEKPTKSHTAKGVRPIVTRACLDEKITQDNYITLRILRLAFKLFCLFVPVIRDLVAEGILQTTAEYRNSFSKLLPDTDALRLGLQC